MYWKKIRKWISKITTLILFILLGIMIFVVITTRASGGEPELFGYQFKTVLSGSMEPAIKTGSIIAVKTGREMDRFKENDIITFKMDSERLVTHRIIEVVNAENGILYRTKGDNNDSPDMNPVMPENIVAKYTGFTIPYLGYFNKFVQSKNGAFLLFIPGVLIVIYAGYTIWKTLSEIDKINKNIDEPNEEKSITHS